VWGLLGGILRPSLTAEAGLTVQSGRRSAVSLKQSHRCERDAVCRLPQVSEAQAALVRSDLHRRSMRCTAAAPTPSGATSASAACASTARTASRARRAPDRKAARVSGTPAHRDGPGRCILHPVRTRMLPARQAGCARPREPVHAHCLPYGSHADSWHAQLCRCSTCIAACNRCMHRTIVAVKQSACQRQRSVPAPLWQSGGLVQAGACTHARCGPRFGKKSAPWLWRHWQHRWKRERRVLLRAAARRAGEELRADLPGPQRQQHRRGGRAGRAPPMCAARR